MTAEGVLVDMVASDSMVQYELAQLVYGLLEEAKTGQWPGDCDDWECRIADRAAEIVEGYLQHYGNTNKEGSQ